MNNQHIVVEEVAEYSYDTAKAIGKLMPDLNTNLSGGPVSKQKLLVIIQSPDRAQLVARIGDEIVGAANLNILVTSTGVKAYLDNFVTAKAYRHQGIGSMILKKVIEIAKQKGATQIAFTSDPDSKAAHRLYQKHFGAIIKDTISFRIPLT